MSKFDEMMAGARETMTVARVFGEPHEADGVTLIPAAVVRGGGGGGESDGGETPPGAGGGFGISARPVGAYQIKAGEVTWIPAVDVTRVAVMGQVVGIVALLVVRSIVRTRRRRRA